MVDTVSTSDTNGKLAALLSFLKQDPDNLTLILEAAETALDEGQPKITKSLLERHASLEPLSKKGLYLSGLTAMKTSQFDTAASIFKNLLETETGDTAIRFNLAWSQAMLKNFDEASAALDETTLASHPQAAMLDIQILHEQGEFEKAMTKAKLHLKNHKDHAGLLAAISVLALDIEDPQMAKECALKAGNHPDALTTLGVLALGNERNVEALTLFEAAMDINAHGPRTWIGMGLSQLSAGDNVAAAANIDKGAELFKTHIGSWIAAGWAHFVLENYKTSRVRFEKALSLDRNFAESHGSLAVLDVIEGHIDQARQSAKTATLLDKECFSAALAGTLILSSQGNAAAAKKIFDRAINTPIDDTGRTIARTLLNMGLSI